MAVNDLTNTKWIFNNTILPSSQQGNLYNITGVITTTYNPSGYQIVYVYAPLLNDGEFAGTDSGYLRQFYQDNNTGLWSVWNDDDQEYDEEDITGFTFTIEGGTDVTNASLISWLEANATQVVEPSSGGIFWGTSSISKVYFGNQEVSKIYLGQVEIYSAEEQLAAPTISLNGDTLTITEVEHAESYGIYVDGVKEATVTPPSSGYTVSGTLTWTSGMGEDYADISIRVYEGDISSESELPPDFFYIEDFTYEDSESYSFNATGTITVAIRGGLSAVVTSATLNGSPLTFTNYHNMDYIWYTVLNITENCTLDINAYGYD